ncbi:MAG TPA: hypothetical protein VGS59_04695 [Candidatus Acidoferrales bacterium]|nr:hypothetical protein [Candidatus Acidoferrales bacterium]
MANLLKFAGIDCALRNAVIKISLAARGSSVLKRAEQSARRPDADATS